MALTDNTETLQNILKEVYNLPNRSSGSSVDATITVSNAYGDNGFVELTEENVQYNESEILKVIEKLTNNQDVNVRLCGANYAYSSDSGWFGTFKPVYVESNKSRLNITFVVKNWDVSMFFLTIRFETNYNYQSGVYDGIETVFVYTTQITE